MKRTPVLGIVIPTLNEAETLPRLLDDLTHLSLSHEVVVADGGSTDGTPSLARERGARVVRSSRGRARQMNDGAAALETRWFLFLHADSRMPEAAAESLVEWMDEAGPRDLGTFRFALEGDHWFWRFIEFGQKIRERLFGLAYGDQGLLVCRERFWEVAGYPDLPLLEDVELLKALRRAGHWKKIDSPLLSSPRRYQAEGRWRGWIRNTLLIGLYSAGVSPEKLARFYPERTGTATGGPGEGQENTLLIFAKAPVPGRVKTRLAVEMGDEEAAEIYREVGGSVVEQVRNGPYRAIVYFDPPDRLQEVRAWLGEEALEFRAQASGDLGARLDRAFRDAFRDARRVVVVGTDAPGVDRNLVQKAFARLERGEEVVLGPANDGGYYLLGLGAPAPNLFSGVPWSTSRVLEATLKRADDAGLRVSLLPPLRDLDTLADWEALGRPGGR